MNERMDILRLIESEEITVAEGVRLLEALETCREAPEVPSRGETRTEPPPGPKGVAPCTRRPAFVGFASWAVFGIGVVVLIVGGWLLAGAYGGQGAPALSWGWVTFVVGLLIMTLGWWLRGARWFYLRVREGEGPRFTLALPLPLGSVAWLVRLAQPVVPQLREIKAASLVLAVRDELRQGRRCVVTVEEGDGGDQVEMYFG